MVSPSTIKPLATSGTRSNPSISFEIQMLLSIESTTLSEFLIELKLNEEQEKITQIVVTGSSGTQVKPSAYDEYVNASKGKVQQKGKGRGGDGKGGKQNWRLPCNDYWKPDGCQHGHHCPRYHLRRQPGRCAICGSTRHYTSQCSRPVKPKAKNAEYDEDSNWQAEAEWHESTWENEEYEASKGKKGKGKRSKSKGKSKGKSTPKRLYSKTDSVSDPSNKST